MVKNVKLALAVLAAGLLAACSTPAPQAPSDVDSSFSNTGLSQNDANAKIYNGYSQNDLRYANNVVYFGFDQFVPTAEYVELIKAHAKFMIQTGAKVLLEGYTDERGTPEYNIALGASRAKETAKLLVQFGVNPTNIRQLSYGEARPAVLGHSEDAYAKNRRVVFNYEF